jgi:putative hydrolase of HD superfamily
MAQHFVAPEFHLLVTELKETPRTGWVKRGIPNPESIGDHTFSSTLLACDFARAVGRDPQEISYFMQNHDQPEVKAGDVSPHCGVSAGEKEKREIEAAQYLADLSGNPLIISMFLEYQDKQTWRAKIGNDADKLDPLTQAIRYARLYPEKREALEDFWPYAHDRLITDVGFRYFDNVHKIWEKPSV